MSEPGQPRHRLDGGSDTLFWAVFEDAIDAMVVANDEGLYVEANSAACRLFGVERDQLLGRNVGDFSESPDGVDVRWQRFLQEGRMEGPFRLRRGDGTVRDVDYWAKAAIQPGLHLSVMRDVTEQRRLAEELRLSRELFERAFRMSPIPLGISTVPEARFIDLNESGALLSGRSRDEVIGRTSAELGFWGDPTHRQRLIGAMEATGRTRDFSTLLRRKDGELREVRLSTEALDVRGQPCVLGVMMDVTERNRAERALRESQYFLELAQTVAHVGSWANTFRPDDRPVWSKESYRIFGLPDDSQVTVQTFLDLVHPDDRDRLMEIRRRAWEQDEPYEIEHRILRPDGQLRWVHVRAVVERAGDGSPIRMIGTVQDVTERYRMLDDLRSSEERYRRIVEGISEGVLMVDKTARILFANEPLGAMLGYAPSELVGRSALDLIEEEWRPKAIAKLAERAQGRGESYRQQFRRRDGTPIWVTIASNPIAAPDGTFEYSLAIVTDVTARHHAEELRNLLAAIVESSDDAIFSTDLDGKIMSWNSAAERLFGYRASEALGNRVSLVIPPELRDQEQRLLDEVLAGQRVDHHETHKRRKDGSLLEVLLTVCPVRDASGNVIGASKIARDLTERRKVEAALRRSEEQLRQSAKMEAVGSLAGGVAHDFNNLLSVILSYSNMMLQDLRDGDPLRPAVQEVVDAGRRASELTRQLLAFSRRQILEPRVIDLNQLVSDVERMLGRLIGADIELSLLTSHDLGKIFVDPQQLEQVVINLVVNARDAMPRGGKLAIETGNVELTNEYVAGHTDVEPGHYVMLAVTDTGIGMDAPTRQRIFEPFFTTKEQGRGTGLGLSMVYGIIRQSGGHIWVYSEPDRGTTFKVYLPRTD